MEQGLIDMGGQQKRIMTFTQKLTAAGTDYGAPMEWQCSIRNSDISGVDVGSGAVIICVADSKRNKL